MATTTSYNSRYRYGDPYPVQVAWPNGVAINVGDLCFVSGPTRTVSDGATTSSSPTLTSNSALFTPGDVGAAVSGTNIPANTTIVSVQSSTSATMSANATGTGSSIAVTITPSTTARVYPAMSYPWTTNLVTTQANFVKQFLGVAAQQYDGVTNTAYGINDGTLRVDTAGFFDFPCVSQSWNVGDLVGVAQDPSSSNNLYAQLVTNVNSAGQGNAIGRCAKGGTNLTTVRIQIFAPMMELYNVGTI